MSTTLTPQAIAEKQVRRAQGAVADYKAGVMGVKVNPSVSAALAVDRWFQGIQDAYNNGTFVEGCNNSTLQNWQEKTAGKGATAYGPGIQAALQTIVDFQTQRQSAQQGINAQLSGMPRGGLEQNIARMVAQVTGMSQFKFKKRRG